MDELLTLLCSPLALLLVILFALGAGTVYGIYDIATRKPPSPEQQWVAQNRQRCDAMRSRLTYDPKTRRVECYRTPFMRRPKLMFEEKYGGGV